jgi:predicted ABC-type ATPase
MTSPFVIAIAGPTGVGKTTLSRMLHTNFNCAYISEDEIAKEIFPDEYTKIESFPSKLKIVEDQLLKKAEEIFHTNKNVVIDLINIERGFIKEIKKRFNNHLTIKILFPSIAITIERDKRKDGWTSGEIAIRRYYKKYEELKLIIGEENYIDNSNQTPKETLEKFFHI